MLVKQIDLKVLCGNDVLAGTSDGATTLSKLITFSADIFDPTLIVLNFVNVTVATASFLRESVLGFRDYCRKTRPNLYPVLAGVGPKVRDELDGLLRLKGDALVLCDLSSSGAITDASVLGILDGKQAVALKAVLRSGPVDAGALAKGDADTPNPTAWSNRLVALSLKGILRETLVGRSKIYEPVVKGLRYGN